MFFSLIATSNDDQKWKNDSRGQCCSQALSLWVNSTINHLQFYQKWLAIHHQETWGTYLFFSLRGFLTWQTESRWRKSRCEVRSMAPEISSSWPWRTGADSLEVPIPYIFGLCNVRPIFTEKKTQLDGLKNGTNVPPSVGSWRSPIDELSIINGLV